MRQETKLIIDMFTTLERAGKYIIRYEDDQVDVWRLPERKTAQHWTEKTPRCRDNWGCDEKRQTEVAWTCSSRKDDADYVKVCTGLVVEGTALVGRQRKKWQNTPSAESWPRTSATKRNGGPEDGVRRIKQRLEYSLKTKKKNCESVTLSLQDGVV